MRPGRCRGRADEGADVEVAVESGAQEQRVGVTVCVFAEARGHETAEARDSGGVGGAGLEALEALLVRVQAVQDVVALGEEEEPLGLGLLDAQHVLEIEADGTAGIRLQAGDRERALAETRRQPAAAAPADLPADEGEEE